MGKVKKLLETAEASVFLKTNEIVKRNIRIGDTRTSVTLEPQVWNILKQVSEEHECNVHQLCEMINERKNPASSLASAIRVFLISYLQIKYSKLKR
tara:strand:+ start:5540 stop:5827 length:288 start_codon:yes stop_codon:yes gene_type:complete